MCSTIRQLRSQRLARVVTGEMDIVVSDHALSRTRDPCQHRANGVVEVRRYPADERRRPIVKIRGAGEMAGRYTQGLDRASVTAAVRECSQGNTMVGAARSRAAPTTAVTIGAQRRMLIFTAAYRAADAGGSRRDGRHITVPTATEHSDHWGDSALTGVNAMCSVVQLTGTRSRPRAVVMRLPVRTFGLSRSGRPSDGSATISTPRSKTN